MSTLAAALALPGRTVSMRAAAVVLVASYAIVVIPVLFGLLRWRSPSGWPPVYRLAVTVAALAGSLSWWWVNGSAEGIELVTFSATHALTSGDLGSVPLLAVAVWMVGSSEWATAVRKTGRKSE